jgi:hypothetical protein
VLGRVLAIRIERDVRSVCRTVTIISNEWLVGFTLGNELGLAETEIYIQGVPRVKVTTSGGCSLC